MRTYTIENGQPANGFPINLFPQRVGTEIKFDQIVCDLSLFPINLFPQRVGTCHRLACSKDRRKFPINLFPQRVGTECKQSYQQPSYR